MDEIRYSAVPPRAQRQQYMPGETMTFIVESPGRACLPGSFRLCGQLIVKDASGNTISPQSLIYFDPYLGAHAFFDKFITYTQSSGEIEAVHDYPRGVKVAKATSTHMDDMYSTADLTELRAPIEQYTAAYISAGLDFVMQPMIAINRSTAPIPYSKTGFIEFLITLNTSTRALYGQNAKGATFVLMNPVLRWTSIPEVPGMAQLPLLMRTIQVARLYYATDEDSVATRMPGGTVYDGVSYVFTNHNQDPSVDNDYAMEFPGVKSVKFWINDAYAGTIAYTITSRGEMLRDFIRSVTPEAESTSAVLAKIRNNDVYGLGMHLSRPLDLSKNELHMQLDTNAGSVGRAYNIFVVGHGSIVLK